MLYIYPCINTTCNPYAKVRLCKLSPHPWWCFSFPSPLQLRDVVRQISVFIRAGLITSKQSAPVDLMCTHTLPHITYSSAKCTHSRAALKWLIQPFSFLAFESFNNRVHTHTHTHTHTHVCLRPPVPPIHPQSCLPDWPSALQHCKQSKNH